MRWLMACVVCLAAICSPGQTGDFSRLERHVKQMVTVETHDGQRIAGELLRVEENRIVVYQLGTPVTAPRETVKRVARGKPRRSAAWIAGMTAAGFGAGLLIGLRVFDDAINSDRKVWAVSLAGSGAGAAAGYGISRAGKSDKVIYQSPQP